MRLFFALPLPADVRTLIHQRSCSLLDARTLRIVGEENLHITISFLGERAQGEVPDLINDAQRLLASFESFPVTFSGVTAFPHAGAPRTIVADVQQGRDECAAMMRAFHAHFFGSPGRKPHPHLTLARVRNSMRCSREQLQKAHRITSEVSCSIDTVVLFSSRLDRRAAVYTPLHTIRL